MTSQRQFVMMISLWMSHTPKGVGHCRGNGRGGFYRCLEVAVVVRDLFGLDWSDSTGCPGAFYGVGASFWV